MEAQPFGCRAIMGLIQRAQATLATRFADRDQAAHLRAEAVETIRFIAAHISDKRLHRSSLDMHNVRALTDPERGR
jgi:hypothetical protein